MPATSTAQRRIARLATLTAVHRAFHWLHLHQPRLRQWQLELVRIPAPPFGESARAAWFLERFRDLGLTNIHLDDAGNALAELQPEPASTSSPNPSSVASSNNVISTEATDSLTVRRAVERPPHLPCSAVLLLWCHFERNKETPHSIFSPPIEGGK
jgi:tripeptide aminopeptidase